MNRIVIIILIFILLLFTGCEIIHLPEINKLSNATNCHNWAMIAHRQVKNTKTNNFTARQALSAWCYAPNCLSMINMFIGEDETQGLRRTFQNLFDNCAGCFDVAHVHNIPNLAEAIRILCEQNEGKEGKRRKV